MPVLLFHDFALQLKSLKIVCHIIKVYCCCRHLQEINTLHSYLRVPALSFCVFLLSNVVDAVALNFGRFI